MRQDYTKWLSLSITTFVHCGSAFSKGWLIKFVSYFAWSWGTISTQNWGSQVFWGDSCLLKKEPKWPKMPWFVCSSITETCFLGIGSLVFFEPSFFEANSKACLSLADLDWARAKISAWVQYRLLCFSSIFKENSREMDSDFTFSANN